MRRQEWRQQEDTGTCVERVRITVSQARVSQKERASLSTGSRLTWGLRGKEGDLDEVKTVACTLAGTRQEMLGENSHYGRVWMEEGWGAPRRLRAERKGGAGKVWVFEVLGGDFWTMSGSQRTFREEMPLVSYTLFFT